VPLDFQLQPVAQRIQHAQPPAPYALVLEVGRLPLVTVQPDVEQVHGSEVLIRGFGSGAAKSPILFAVEPNLDRQCIAGA
jgi:hypothetical protein